MTHPMMFAEDYLDFDDAEAEAEVRSALPTDLATKTRQIYIATDRNHNLIVNIDRLKNNQSASEKFYRPTPASCCRLVTLLAGKTPCVSINEHGPSLIYTL